jgi:hypothetical protein
VKTLDLLEQALSREDPVTPDREIERRLLESAARDIEQLLPQLGPRAEEVGARAKVRLEERGQREAKELRATLEHQRKRVLEEIEKHDEQFKQLTLGFMEEEIRQLEADIRAWKLRLEEFDRDLETEPDRIAEFYEVRAQRVEPVGLVYLWPETN